jgi:hypothetical protein
LLVFGAILAPNILFAQVPRLADIPDNLPAEQHQKLTQAKESLLQRRNDLVKKVANHNGKCGAVEKDSRDWNTCSSEQTKLETDRNQYTNAVNEFNRVVEQDICSQVGVLQTRFESLRQEINVDRQVIKNFGFEKTVEEIEFWGNLPERQMEDAKSAFKALLLDAAIDSVSEAASAVGSLTTEEVDQLNLLADSQGAHRLGIVAGAKDLHKSLEFLEKTKSTYETADAVKRREILNASIKLWGLASNNHAFGLLLSADGWAAYQVYQSATAVKTVHDLTRVNEGDLILLKSRSEKLKNEADQMTGIKKQLLESSSKCDSTKN